MWTKRKAPPVASNYRQGQIPGVKKSQTRHLNFFKIVILARFHLAAPPRGASRRKIKRGCGGVGAVGHAEELCR